MVSFRVITDSTTDLPPGISIPFAPVHVYAGVAEFLDKIDFTVETLLDMAKKWIKRRTSAPSVKDWMRTFETVGSELPIIAVTISSKLSASFKSAGIAARMLGKKGYQIYVVDSLSGSIGAGILVKKALEMAEKNTSVTEVLAKLQELAKRVRIYLVVADMDAAARSGRLPNVLGKIGKFFDLHPIFVVKDGKFHLWKTVRGLDRVTTELLALSQGRNEVWAGTLGKNEYAYNLFSELKKRAKNVTICDIDPAVGAHLGYGSFGIAFLE